MNNSLDKMLKALGDPTRLRIIGILLIQEACSCDMLAVLGVRQSLLSRHLGYLRYAGLIRDRRVGTRIYCSLALEGDVGKALREFLQSIMPHFGPFEEDASKMKAHMERSGWMKKAVAESGRPEGEDSAKEIRHGDQSTAV